MPGEDSNPPEKVLCPDCHAAVDVAPDWRLARCPACGRAIARMELEPEYD